MSSYRGAGLTQGYPPAVWLAEAASHERKAHEAIERAKKAKCAKPRKSARDSAKRHLEAAEQCRALAARGSA